MSSEAFRPDEDSPSWLLKQIIDLSNDLGVRMACSVDLGPTDFRALGVLFVDGPTGPRDLGRRLGLAAPSATALADRLERAGHVVRERTGEDRRRVTLVPTEHARQEAMRVLMPLLIDLGTEVEALEPHEREIVTRFLRRVVEVHRRHLDP